MRDTTTTGTRTAAVEVPPLLAARGVHAWSITEADGTTTICLDVLLGPAEAAAATRRLLARMLPGPRPATA